MLEKRVKDVWFFYLGPTFISTAVVGILIAIGTGKIMLGAAAAISLCMLLLALSAISMAISILIRRS